MDNPLIGWIVNNPLIGWAGSRLVARQLPFAISRSSPSFTLGLVNIVGVSTDTAFIPCVSTDTGLIPHVSTDTGLKRRFPPTVFSNVALTAVIETTHNCPYIGGGESLWDRTSVGCMA